jgi:hypothetical protein
MVRNLAPANGGKDASKKEKEILSVIIDPSSEVSRLLIAIYNS